MNSSVSSLAGLQTWDKHAIDCLYDAVCASAGCTSVGISTQPASKTIGSGTSTTLTVVATGDSPQYQWYIGTQPDTSTPTGTNSATLNTGTLTTTTSYWVRVSNACPSSADSTTATVTIQACVPVSISGSTPADKTINSGSATTLTISPTGTSPYTYKWYAGTSGDVSGGVRATTQIFNTGVLTTTSTFWVEVTGQCGSPVNSRTVTVNVNVVTCVPPQITSVTDDLTINPGNSTALTVQATGTAPLHYQWFKGNSGDMSSSTGTDSKTLQPAPTVTTKYWVRVTGQCGSPQNSRTITVTVTQACVPPAITVEPEDQFIQAGESATLTVEASNATSIDWYQGVAPDKSVLLGTAGTEFTTGPLTTTTTYWANAIGECGEAPSRTVVVNVQGAVCDPPSVISTTSSQDVGAAGSLTLTVTATGTGPLHYTWYQGPFPDIGVVVGSDSPTFTTPSLLRDTQYWVQVSNDCGTAPSQTIFLNVTPGKRRASRH